MTKSWISSKSLIRNDLEEMGISYDVENRSVKYPRLEFKSANKLLVVLPLEIKDESDFITKKKNWIKNKFNSIKKAILIVENYKEEILDIIKSNGALDYTYKKAEEFSLKSKEIINQLPKSSHRNALFLFSEFILDRNK